MPQNPRTRSLLAGATAIAGALATTAAVWIAGTGAADAGTISGTFYADPNSQVLRWLAANPNDSRAALIRERIGSQPQGRWFANYAPGTITSEVTTYVNGANAAGKIPIAVVYEIPNRDCGGASAGGAPDLNAYRSWVQSFAAGLGKSTAVVILEPDSLALQTCLNSSQVAERDAALSQAVSTIKGANPSAKVYLDGGHSAWNSAGDQANRLVQAGVRSADGFYTNVSNFRPTANEVAYGKNILSAIGASNLHQVVDTSRNGKGPNGSEWCDPGGRGIGTYPTANTGEATVDALLWVKPPGEADGCAAAAGTFVPDIAYQLAANGSGPPPAPTQNTTPDPTGSAACSVAYKVDSQWSGGFTATVTVTNRGAQLNGWTLGFSFTGDQKVASAWNGSATQNGTAVSVRDGGFNGVLATGASASFGFQATFSGTNTAPGAYTLNGTACN